MNENKFKETVVDILSSPDDKYNPSISLGEEGGITYLTDVKNYRVIIDVNGGEVSAAAILNTENNSQKDVIEPLENWIYLNSTLTELSVKNPYSKTESVE